MDPRARCRDRHLGSSMPPTEFNLLGLSEEVLDVIFQKVSGRDRGMLALACRLLRQLLYSRLSCLHFDVDVCEASTHVQVC